MAAEGLYQPRALALPQIVYKSGEVENYLNQSLLYLENPQATVREAAVRFIGESPETHFWPPGPSPHWWARWGHSGSHCPQVLSFLRDSPAKGEQSSDISSVPQVLLRGT